MVCDLNKRRQFRNVRCNQPRLIFGDQRGRRLPSVKIGKQAGRHAPRYRQVDRGASHSRSVLARAVESLSSGRTRHSLRTRHRVQWTDSRTSKLVDGRQCSDAEPSFDADQDQHSGGGAEQNNLADWNAPLHSAHHSSRGEHSLVEFRGPDV